MEMKCKGCKKDIIAFEILKTNEELVKNLINPVHTNIGVKCYCGIENEIMVDGKFSIGPVDDETYIEALSDNNYQAYFEVKKK